LNSNQDEETEIAEQISVIENPAFGRFFCLILKMYGGYVQSV